MIIEPIANFTATIYFPTNGTTTANTSIFLSESNMMNNTCLKLPRDYNSTLVMSVSTGTVSMFNITYGSINATVMSDSTYRSAVWIIPTNTVSDKIRCSSHTIHHFQFNTSTFEFVITAIPMEPLYDVSHTISLQNVSTRLFAPNVSFLVNTTLPNNQLVIGDTMTMAFDPQSMPYIDGVDLNNGGKLAAHMIDAYVYSVRAGRVVRVAMHELVDGILCVQRHEHDQLHDTIRESTTAGRVHPVHLLAQRVHIHGNHQYNRKCAVDTYVQNVCV